MTTPQDLLLTEVHPAGYAVLTLNRPQAMNALSRSLLTALADEIDRLATDPGVRVLILTGAGRAFCAGLDLKEIGAGEGSVGGLKPSGQRAKDPVQALARFDGPVIGAINGAAVTGGFELALACDILLASPEARFADTHARVGIAPGWGLSQKLSRVIGPYRAREVSFTGNWVPAEQAAAWGLVNRVVPADDLLTQARALAQDMLGTLPAMLRRYKAIINEGYALPLGEALALERQRAAAFNSEVDAGGVEQRREAVRERNRRS
ncbi:enoyl-CoA hydratase [Aquabacterium sp.]|uniref:enoyl-CoA hydratase n=1 Tax=Aquabacterium sp. TaxID=1872578 RepID=UPI002CCE0A4F|nr:enoyl-CoA hydratase [Aquabacterium sp.]HSW08248.1 enoyl-CoA hydratase [Aquabacterium sp.]